jgi:hypothetical protein
MPVTQNGSYDVPVMARRDLHGDYRSYGSSSFTSSNSIFSSPKKFISNVRSQLTNGYSAIRDRLTHSSQQKSAPNLNSPSSLGAGRYSRTSSQSSATGQGQGYKLRSRAPIHSTPRDNETEHRKTSSKQRKSQDGDENEDEEVEEHHHHKEGKDDKNKDNIIVRFIKKILHSPIDLLSFIWHKFFGLPWWLLIPLLLFLGLYACKYIPFSFPYRSSVFSCSSSFGM